MTYRIGFVMDQIAGHVTNYYNLRAVASSDSTIEADWYEIYYEKQGGKIEQIRNLLPFIPSYVTGISRATWEIHKALRGYQKYHALYTNASVAGFFNFVYRRIPTMIDFDSTPMQIDSMTAYTATPDPVPVAKLKWEMTRRMYQSATLLQVWSRWVKQSVVGDYGIDPAKIVINPPGVNLDYWRPHASLGKGEARRPLRVLFVGGDFRRKGGELLLEWYKGQDPRATELHVVTREPVEARPGVYVYHNMQPNTPELVQLYHEADLFVLPSLGECFGIATVEAMATGLPAIASNAGGTADIIEPGRNGFIVPVNDVSALGQAIESILGDAALRERMGVQSRVLAEERFDLTKNAQRTFGYLKQIARTDQQPIVSTHAEQSR